MKEHLDPGPYAEMAVCYLLKLAQSIVLAQTERCAQSPLQKEGIIGMATELATVAENLRTIASTISYVEALVA